MLPREGTSDVGPSLRQFLMVANSRRAGLPASRDIVVSTSHLSAGTLGL